MAVLQPLVQLLAERVVGEGLAPQRRVGDAGLGQRTVEVQHADEARPLAGPVGDGEDRSAMADQARQDVVGVLPDRLGHDDRRVRDRSLAKTSRPSFWLAMKPCLRAGS